MPVRSVRARSGILIISHFHVSITSEEYNKSTLEYKLNCNENSNTNQRLNTGTQDSHACLPSLRPSRVGVFAFA